MSDEIERGIVGRPFTFVHAADLHLDAPFQGVDAEDERVRAALVDATYVALDRIVEAAITRAADLVVIAGDTYNSRDKSLRAQLRFRAAMERLSSEGIGVFVAQGNHDPANGWSARLPLPAGIHYFPTDHVERIEVNVDGEALCALYGCGYEKAATTANLARGFRREPADETAIGVLHANVGGQPGFEPYAPCSLDDLRAAGMDYWALGHIHKPLELLDSPRVRYSGSPQGLNPKEDGPHGCWFVTMDRGQVIAEEFVETASVAWEKAVVDATSLTSIDAVGAAVRDACATVRNRSGARPTVLRIDITGRSDAHGDLARGETFSDLVAEARDEQLGESPWVWLDRIRDLTRPVIDLDFMRGAQDFTGDLIRITEELLDDPALADAFVDEALVEIESGFDMPPRDASALLERARDACLDRLVGPGEQ